MKRKPEISLEQVTAARVQANLSRAEVARRIEPKPKTREWLRRVETRLIYADRLKLRAILVAIMRVKRAKAEQMVNTSISQVAQNKQ